MVQPSQTMSLIPTDLCLILCSHVALQQPRQEDTPAPPFKQPVRSPRGPSEPRPTRPDRGRWGYEPVPYVRHRLSCLAYTPCGCKTPPKSSWTHAQTCARRGLAEGEGGQSLICCRVRIRPLAIPFPTSFVALHAPAPIDTAVTGHPWPARSHDISPGKYLYGQVHRPGQLRFTGRRGRRAVCQADRQRTGGVTPARQPADTQGH